MIWARMRTFPALKKEKQPSFEREENQPSFEREEETIQWKEKRGNNTALKDKTTQLSERLCNNQVVREV